MTKLFLTLLLFSTMLLTSTPSTLTTKASSPDGQKTPDAQAKAKVESALRDAAKTATYDQAGRVTKLTLPGSDNKTVGVGLTYDEQGRIRYIVQEDGVKLQLTYDNTGQWQGVIFPDGGRMTLEKDQAGNVVGFRTQRPAATRKTAQLKGTSGHGARLRKASAAVPDPCQEATQRATAAVLSMAAACISGPSVPCALATANAAYLSYLAYQACKSGGVATEESAA